MVVWLLWLSGITLAAQARGVLGSTPGDCRHLKWCSKSVLCLVCGEAGSESGV